MYCLIKKSFYRQTWHYSLLFLLLEDNILNAMFYHFHLEKIIENVYLLTENVYLLFENLDQLSDLNIGFVHMFLDLIDICSN